MKKIIPLILTFLLIAQPCFAATELDYFEYPDDAAAQAAYPSNDTTSAPIIVGDTADNTVHVGKYSNQIRHYAQSITLTHTTKIYEVRVTFGANYGTPSGDVTLTIETDSSGDPSGTLAHASATKAVTNPSASAENTWTFASSFSLAAGYYWIVLRCDEQADNKLWRPNRSNASVYSGGVGSQYIAGTWTSNNDHDLQFKLYGETLQCYSESTIKQQGSYSLKGVAAITDSLNKTLTRTTDPTIDLSGISQIKFDIRASRTGSNIKIGWHDSGGTTTEHTPNILTANTWQTETVDISGVADANKDVIDWIKITIVNADAANTFYLDNMYGEAVAVEEAQVFIIN